MLVQSDARIFNDHSLLWTSRHIWTTMARYPDAVEDVPDNLPIPK